MEVIVEESPEMETTVDNIEISVEDWVVSDKEYQESFETWKKENIVEPEMRKKVKTLFEAQEKNYKGYESTLKKRKQIVNEEYKNIYDKLKLPYYDELEKKDRFVQVYENALTHNFCDHLIKIFEENPDYHALYAGTAKEKMLIKKDDGEININNLKGIASAKTTTEIYLNDHPTELGKEDKYICQQLGKYLSKYIDEMDIPIDGDNNLLIGYEDTGYQIQKYIKGEGRYIFHHDEQVNYNEVKKRMGIRTVTFLFYLNDVEEGGETTFVDFQIKPKKGSVLFFPATWNYIHSGNIPLSSDKYIVTGWIWKYSKV